MSEAREIRLLSYIPDFLKEVREYLFITETEDTELQGLYTRTLSLWEDGFIQTAGYQRIRKRENLLGIRGGLGASLEERRAAVQAAWSRQLPYTRARLAEQLNGLLGKEGYELFIRNRIYELELDVIDQSYPVLNQVREIVRKMVPANLDYRFAGKYPGKTAVKVEADTKMSLSASFYPRGNREFLYLDGGWRLDQSYALCGYKEAAGLEYYPVRLKVLNEAAGAIGTDTSQVQVRTGTGEPVELEAEALCQSDIGAAVSDKQTMIMASGAAVTAACAGGLTVEKNLWFLDGVYLLDGAKQLSASMVRCDL